MPAAKKEVVRCHWATGGNELYHQYHDEAMGRPLVYDDRKQFEFDAQNAQAGLSWSTILNKREGYRLAFADFDPQQVARFTEKRIERSSLIRASSGIDSR